VVVVVVVGASVVVVAREDVVVGVVVVVEVATGAVEVPGAGPPVQADTATDSASAAIRR
jgi:hypothetical protein